MYKKTNFILFLLLIILGISLYIIKPFKKEFDLSKVKIETIDGKMKLDNYFTKKTILYFGYSICPKVCPMTLGYLSEALNRYEKPDIKAIFISLSPHDTLEMVHNNGQNYHKKIFGIDIPQKDVKLLSNWLNVQYRNLDTKEINHSGNLYIFSDKILVKVLPFGTDSETILKEIKGIK